MRYRWSLAIFFLLAAVLLGCGSASTTLPADTDRIQAEQLIGTWHLVQADGQSPAALNVKSLTMEISPNGTWTSAIEMQGQFEGMSMAGGGKWSLTDRTITYTSGANSGESKAWLKEGRLILDPDFTLRRDGSIDVSGEYER